MTLSATLSMPVSLPGDEPRELRLHRQELDLREYKHRMVREDDVATVVRESTLIFNAETRELEIVYLVLDDDVSAITAALHRVEMLQSARSSGMRSNSRVFGNQPRNLPRRDFCTAASLARDEPAAHDLIASYASRVSTYYQHYNPDRYRAHEQKAADVLEEWRLEKTPFTSGIINRNNQLPYHFDAGNFSGVWSNMLVFKHRIAGGYLAVPEYDVAFELPNNSLLMFDGQSLMHGVTPFRKLADDSWRYSIVYYSLKSMWKCMPIDMEVIAARKRRTEREYRRYERTLKGETWDGEA